MVQDTIVGVLGAVLIVGSMVVAIDAADTGASDDTAVEAPPPAQGESVWRAEDCEAASLYWTPSMSALGEVVGPNYEPAPGPGPQPDTGLFWLFAFECGRANVDGLRVSPPSGAAAIVAIQEPDDTRNVSAPDGWAAVPAWYGPSTGAVTEVFDKHGFNVEDGSGAVGTTSNPLADEVRLSIDAPDGTVEASMTVTGPSTTREVEGALVGTNPDLFSVFHGPERMDRRANGTATVETSGTTWVERLDLDPTPYAIAYDTGMRWNFTFEHEPFESNATDGGEAVSSETPLPSKADLARWAWGPERVLDPDVRG